MLGKGVEIMEVSMKADAGDAGFSLVTLPEHVRCAYRIGRQAGRLMAELTVLVRAMAVRGRSRSITRNILQGSAGKTATAAWMRS